MTIDLKNMTSSYYVFDVKTLSERVNKLREMLPKNVDLCYAVKANPFIIKEIAPLVERLEVCSPGEADICEKLHIPTAQMVISGVYKSVDFIEKLVAQPNAQYIHTIESISHLHLLDKLSKQYNVVLPVLIRLTNNSQFGIDEQAIDDIIANRSTYTHLKFKGIQFFSGTQKFSVKKYARELKKLDDYLWHLQNDYSFVSEELEYGTGFPVSYFKDETFDEENLMSEFSALLNTLTYKAHITLEVGRSLVASCGRYFTPVVDVKTSKKQQYAMVDGGLHHMQYFGQYMGIKHPYVSVIGKETQPSDETYIVCGSLCTMNDILVKDIPLPKLAIGDFLVFDNAGGYSMTEGMSLFLSRDLPSVFLKLLDGNLICVRERFETSTLNLPNY